MRQSPFVNYAPFSWVSPPSNETQVKGRGKAVKNEGGQQPTPLTERRFMEIFICSPASGAHMHSIP